MNRSFKKLIVLIDPSLDSEMAVKKAIQFADPGSVIHLINIDRSTGILSFFRKLILQGSEPSSNTNDHKSCDRLSNLKLFAENLHPGINIQLENISNFFWNQAIVNKLKRENADLLIMSGYSSKSFQSVFNTLHPNKLAEKISCPILIVQQGATHQSIRTVVIPVTDKIPYNKLFAIAALAKKNKLSVHIVTFINNTNSGSGALGVPIIKSFQWIQTYINCLVRYSVLHGSNRASSLLEYAENVNADILLVYPKTETRLGWYNGHIFDALPCASRVQIMSVHPENAHAINTN